jgi:hypothetical protein
VRILRGKTRQKWLFLDVINLRALGGVHVLHVPKERDVRRLFLILWLALQVFAVCSCSRDEKEAVPNVRLGMAPRDVRDRFQPSVDGTWQTALGTGDDTVLEWTARDPKAQVAQARFEFHLGMLVAIRARVNDAATSEQVTSTSKTVTLRAPAREGGTSITVLARDCPTHKDEAEAIFAKGSAK